MTASKGKKRILHVLKSSIYSGAENVILTMIDQLKDEYEFGYLASEGTIRGVLEERGIHAILLKNYTRKNVKQAIENFKPDIVHAHDFTASVYCASIKGGKNSFKLISQLHYGPPWTHRWNLKTALYFFASFRIEIIIGVSKRSIENMVFSKMLWKKIKIVNNPIDKDMIHCKSNECIGEKGNQLEKKYNDKKFDLIFVGRLEDEKDPISFIRIAAEIGKQCGKLDAVILGDGSLFTQCELAIKSLDVDDNIKISMIGFVNNPYCWIKRSKILCMTSKWEGYGLVAAEASVLGIPVLSTRTEGIEELFGGKTEMICDSDCDMVNKAVRLLKEPELYVQWKMKITQATTHFTQNEDFAKQLNTIYKGNENG